MMRIGVNLFELIPPGSRGAGVLNYMRGLLQGLAAVDDRNTYFLFVNRFSQGTYPVSGGNFHEVVVPFNPHWRWTRVLWEQIVLPWVAWRLKLDLIHCPASTASVALRKKCVVTVHATNLHYYKEHFPRRRIGLRQFYLEAMQRWVLPRARVLITVSEHSRQEIIRHLHVAGSRVRVVYHALVKHQVTESIDITHLVGSGPYVLGVSSGAVHKNLPGLIRAYARVRQRLDSVPQLIIVGWIPDRPTWGMYSKADLQRCIMEQAVQRHVRVLAFVSDDELDALYRGAILFVFPSLYEGFGHVVLEAMRHGVPTVVSDRASIPEVAGDATVYVNPEDDEDVARGMERVLADDALRERLKTAGLQRVASFGGWDRVARETLAVFETEQEGAVNER